MQSVISRQMLMLCCQLHVLLTLHDAHIVCNLVIILWCLWTQCAYTV